MIVCGDCREIMAGMEAESVDSVVTDPPYELGFMGKAWDGSGVAYGSIWCEALRVLKPGGHLLAFGGSRTYHRLACAIEDAGFEIRDQIMWLYGSGFPKSFDVSKAIDKAAGAEREDAGPSPFAARKPNGCRTGPIYGDDGDGDPKRLTAPATPDAHLWNGWGTALKPAHEPICVARKPLIGTVAANVLEHGTGAINIDRCRVDSAALVPGGGRSSRGHGGVYGDGRAPYSAEPHASGRWPASVCHDGSEEVLERMPEGGGHSDGTFRRDLKRRSLNTARDDSLSSDRFVAKIDVGGSASRFFYCAKATRAERQDHNLHPTVKPVALMRWLVRLVTPPGGLVLDPFLGSGTTAIACEVEGFRWLGIEKDPHYAAIARQRIRDDKGASERAKLEGRAPGERLKAIAGPLFD